MSEYLVQFSATYIVNETSKKDALLRAKSQLADSIDHEGLESFSVEIEKR